MAASSCVLRVKRLSATRPVEGTRVRLGISLVVLLIGALLTSCATRYLDLVAHQSVTLAVTPEGSVVMTDVTAYQEDDHLRIAGAIWQQNAAWRFSGWVYVSVILDNGEILEERCSRVVPRRGPRLHVHMDRLQASFFHISLPTIPPPGSVIRVVGSARAAFCT